MGSWEWGKLKVESLKVESGKRPFDYFKTYVVKNLNMRQINKLVAVAFLLLVTTALSAQQSVHTSGGEAQGPGGTVSYSVGQVAYEYQESQSGNVSQGVQQAFEIYTVFVAEKQPLNIELNVYPNPTIGELKLHVVFDGSPNRKLNYQLYDLSGKLLQSKALTSDITVIDVQNYAGANYFLRVSDNNTELKTFRIVKH